MPTFSIIIPVYGVENYIKRCLDSVFAQTYGKVEVIVVNDGTKDNSMEIVKNYQVKIINQENAGLSAARNTGVKYATGDYIFFLDSDDYIEPDLLLEVSKMLDNNPDLIRFQIREVFEDNTPPIDYNEIGFLGIEGVEAFDRISRYHFVENAWSYIIRREYYLNNNFEFKVGTMHEDFGLMPLVIIKSRSVNSLNYIGYNYLQRQGSIMNNNDYEKTKKKVADFYNHYLFLLSEIDKTNLRSDTFKSFIANSLIIKVCELEKEDYKAYKKKLKEDKVFDNLLTDSTVRKIKKIVFKINPKLGVKLLNK